MLGADRRHLRPRRAPGRRRGCDLVDRVVVLAAGRRGGRRRPAGAVFAGARGAGSPRGGVWVPGHLAPCRARRGAPAARDRGLRGRRGRGRAGGVTCSSGPRGRRCGRPGPAAPAVARGRPRPARRAGRVRRRAERCGQVHAGAGAGRAGRAGGRRACAAPALAGGRASGRRTRTAGGPRELVTRIGTVFQEPQHQFVAATVRRRARGRAAADRRCREAETRPGSSELLDRLRLTELARANPFTLSGGEQRRLSVATVLATRPAGPGARRAHVRPGLRGPGPSWSTCCRAAGRRHRRGRRRPTTRRCRGPVGGRRPRARDGTAAAPDDAAARAGRACAAAVAPCPTSPDGPAGVDLDRRRSPGPTRSPSSPSRWRCRSALLLTVDPVTAGAALVLELLALPWCGLGPRALLRRGWVVAGRRRAGRGRDRAVRRSTPAASSSALGPGHRHRGLGAGAGLAITLRVLAIGLPGVVLLATTDPTDLADALAQMLRLPPRFVLSALAAMRLFGVLAEEWQALTLARRARGLGDGGPLGAGVATRSGQVFALLVLAVRRATVLATTMESRGFGVDRDRAPGPGRAGSPGRDAAVVAGGVLVGRAGHRRRGRRRHLAAAAQLSVRYAHSCGARRDVVPTRRARRDVVPNTPDARRVMARCRAGRWESRPARGDLSSARPAAARGWGTR